VFDTGYAKVVGANHLKLELYQEENPRIKIAAIGFGMGDFLPFFKDKRPADICYTINENTFNNSRMLQVVIRGIKFQ